MKNQRSMVMMTIYLLVLYVVIFNNSQISKAKPAPEHSICEVTALVLINAKELEAYKDLYVVAQLKILGADMYRKVMLDCDYMYPVGYDFMGIIGSSDNDKIISKGNIIKAKASFRGDEHFSGDFLGDIKLIEDLTAKPHSKCNVTASLIDITRSVKEVSLPDKKTNPTEQYYLKLKIEENNSPQDNSMAYCSESYKIGSEITGIISANVYMEKPIFLGQKINTNIFYSESTIYNGYHLVGINNIDYVSKLTSKEKEELQKKINTNLIDYINKIDHSVDLCHKKTPSNELCIESLKKISSTLERMNGSIPVRDSSTGEIVFAGVLVPDSLGFVFNSPALSRNCKSTLKTYWTVSSEKGYDWLYDNCFKWKEFRGYAVGDFIHLTEAKDISPAPEAWINGNIDNWKKNDYYQWLKEQ